MQTEMLLISDLCVLLLCVCVDASGPRVNITAVLGHTATFKCPWDSHIPVPRLYIQKVNEVQGSSEIYINGFDSNRDSQMDIFSSADYLNRTKVNRTAISMEMTNVSVSDEGLYKCYIFYGTVATLSKVIPEIYLKVTGMAQ